MNHFESQYWGKLSTYLQNLECSGRVLFLPLRKNTCPQVFKFGALRNKISSSKKKKLERNWRTLDGDSAGMERKIRKTLATYNTTLHIRTRRKCFSVRNIITLFRVWLFLVQHENVSVDSEASQQAILCLSGFRNRRIIVA